MSIPRRKAKSPDSRDIYHDKKTGVYYNHHFWNIENINSEHEDEVDFFQCVSAPVIMQSSKVTPKKSPLRNREAKKNIISESTQTFHSEQVGDTGNPPFTIRLGRKQLCEHPTLKGASQSQNQLRQPTTRPKSAAVHYTCSKNKNFMTVKLPSAKRITRPHSSPTPTRTGSRITSTALDNESTSASREILAAYINSTNCSFSGPCSTVTPSSLKTDIAPKSCRKAWVKDDEFEPVKDESDLGKLLQQPRRSDVNTKIKRQDGRVSYKSVPETNKDHVRRRRMISSAPVCRGSNWSKKTSSDIARARYKDTLASNAPNNKNAKLKVDLTLPTYDEDYSVLSHASQSIK